MEKFKIQILNIFSKWLIVLLKSHVHLGFPAFYDYLSFFHLYFFFKKKVHAISTSILIIRIEKENKEKKKVKDNLCFR